MAAGRGHQPGGPHRRLLLQRRDGVRVGVERDGDGRVSEALGDDLGVDAGAQRQGGMRVTQVVQAYLGQLRRL